MSKINFYNLKDLINNGISPEEMEKIIIEILNVTLPAKEDYPEYKQWFLNKQVKGINVDRNILFAKYNDQIVGVVNIKDSTDEKKICTLYIKDVFRKNYIGSQLVKMACDELGTSKPLITISSNKIYDFRKIILDNNWELCDELSNYYKASTDEYVFNGSLYLPAKKDNVKEIIKICSKNKNIIRFNYIDFKRLFKTFLFKSSSLKNKDLTN